MCVCSLSDAMGLTPCGVCARVIDSFHLNFLLLVDLFISVCIPYMIPFSLPVLCVMNY